MRSVLVCLGILVLCIGSYALIYAGGYRQGMRAEEKLLFASSDDNGDIQKVGLDTTNFKSGDSVIHFNGTREDTPSSSIANWRKGSYIGKGSIINIPKGYNYIDWDEDIDNVGSNKNPTEAMLWSRHDTLFVQIEDK